MAHKLHLLKDQIAKAGLSLPARSMREEDASLDDLEIKFAELEAELVEMNSNSDKLLRSYNELAEYKLVLQKADEFFHSTQRSAHEQASNQSVQETATDPSKQVKLGFVAGLVPRAKSMAFERIIFRATRGNVFLRQAVVQEPVTDPVLGEKVEKNAFVVFFSGEKEKFKILKIYEAFGVNRYPFTDDPSKQARAITEASGRLSGLKTTIDAGLLHRGNLL